MPLLFEVFFFFIVGAVSASLTSDYYQQLIAQETAKSLTYELPKKNEEFKTGYESNAINDYGEYDLVIVGAGTAGCILATRLSEIAKISILLLEAGGEENDFNQILAMWPYNLFSDFNWGYFSTPQKRSCLGMNNSQCVIYRGKVIGGGSSINGAMYVRGNCKDYDNWAALGNRGWSCKDVLPYFKKSENSQVDGDEGYHGIGGFWNIEYSLPESPLLHTFINGSLETNLPFIDYNGRSQIGVSKLQSNIKRGRRQSFGTAFLNNARKRSNLKVVTKALVTKITIDRRSKQATGIEFVTNNKKFRVRAKKEVIVSAGAINTPQLLMLSGIGPRNHLKDMKIPLVVDLPVGKNLMEHPVINLIIHTNYTAPNISTAESVEQFLNGLGPLTKGANLEGLSFFHTRNSSTEGPQIQLITASPYAVDASLFPKLINFNTTIGQAFSKQLQPQNDMVWYVVLLHEKSRGQILLQSNNPIDFPNIDLNMFEEQDDVDVFSEGLEYAFRLLETEAFKKVNATLLDISLCGDSGTRSKQYMECLMRNLAGTGYHPIGTAAMGPDPRKFVVDDKLRVHGVGNMRVIDASIFPLGISGNTNAPTAMVAEKGADIIKAELK
ncbi:glucose dehydrogenase [FAD, quinone]-like [Zophobas morio]|uniref:glucose dehydrogenase [FAD, quinone]-like n=1 Tax=Zophobas morio TaxID=2755281 RepID=UPI0030836818